jgi:hypothetical protein
MRAFRLLIAATALLLAAGIYTLLPFSAAWAIREAVTRGDTDYIERKVHWPTVRESMRQSMLSSALELPEAGSAGIEVEPSDAPRPGLWKRLKTRLKTYAGSRVVDKMVATYVSAEGLPRLYRQRMMTRAAMGAPAADPEAWSDRFREVWSRVRRAELLSLTAFEIELADQFAEDRSYIARLELQRFEWILTELRIVRPSLAMAAR